MKKKNKVLRSLVIIILILIICFVVVKGIGFAIKNKTLSQMTAHVQPIASKYGFSDVKVVDYSVYGTYMTYNFETATETDSAHCILYIESAEFDNTRITDIYKLLNALDGRFIKNTKHNGYPAYLSKACLCPSYDKDGCMAYKSRSGNPPHVVYASAFYESRNDTVLFVDGGSTTVKAMNEGKTYSVPIRPTVPASSSDEDNYGHDKFDAMVIAEKVVKSKLKSPSTADFCSTSDYTVSCVGNSWTVTGYVDAQNGFGATVRNTFTVKFTFSSSSQYTVDSCSIT